MIKNQIPGDIDVVGAGSQLREQGSTQIVEGQLPTLFFELYKTVNCNYAAYCDFTQKYPFDINANIGELALSIGVPALLLENVVLKSFDSAKDSNDAVNIILANYMPWINAVDDNGEETFAYSIQLTQKVPGSGNDTARTPDSDPVGFRTLFTPSFGTSPTNTDNTVYDMKITASESMKVRAFGLMYNITILE